MAQPDEGFTMVDPDEQIAILRRGVLELISDEELRAKLAQGRPLIVKAGFDPTAPDLHLGHLVLLRKLAQFQRLGHRVVFLIGDYTAMIGDPSGRVRQRPVLSPQEVLENAQLYKDRIAGILDTDRLEIRFNSEWLGPMRLADFLAVAGKLTVPRLIERDDFAERLKAGVSLTVTESLYPLLQAYDSVVLKADVEVGGSDQKFNLLLGRTLQERFGLPPQVVLTLPLLEGTDGVAKMSKSLGNAIGLKEPPEEMYGKLMSIPDALMVRYFDLLTDEDVDAVQRLHPMEAKQRLARTVTASIHGDVAAQRAEEQFNRIFRQRQLPEVIPEFQLSQHMFKEGKVPLLPLLVATQMASSKSHARRLVEQKGVELDGQPLTDPNMSIAIRSGAVLRVGKRRFLKLILPSS
jgi:tyrosyl-tRNA synthetase